MEGKERYGDQLDGSCNRNYKGFIGSKGFGKFIDWAYQNNDRNITKGIISDQC